MNEHERREQPATAPDPLIDEVRAVRRALSERFGNDPVRLCEHLKSLEGKTGGPVVRRRPRTEEQERRRAV